MYDHDASAIRVHMDGLRDLIELRGGLKCLPVTLARHLRKYDLLYTSISLDASSVVLD